MKRSNTRKQAIAWTFYDFANSAYAWLILSFVYAVYFRDYVAPAGAGDFWWGFAVSVSTVVGGILSPILGAAADHTNRRKLFFIITAISAIIGMGLLYFTGPSVFFFSLVIFILTNITFELAQSLYDAFLSSVSTPRTAGFISGLGYALGYAGGIVATLAFMPLYVKGFEANPTAYKLAFPLTGLFVLIFAIPSFILLKDAKRTRKQNNKPVIKEAIAKTLRTIREVKKHKNIAWFLLAWFILNDALVTAFAFLPIYGKVTIGLTLKEILIFGIAGQVVAVPATIILGKVSDKIGPKKVVLGTIIAWAVMIALAATLSKKEAFFGIVLGIGLVIGASQAVTRAWYSRIIPKNRQAEFFGFNAFASKVAAVSGPIVFGAIATLTGSQRIAWLAILPYFIIAFIIFSRQPEPRKRTQEI
jgi:UMF1 family MFS transporter